MLDIGKLSISWICELNVSNNQLKVKAIALDKIIQIEFNVILFMSIESQYNEIQEIGDTIDVSHEYRVLDPKDMEIYPYSYNAGAPCHIVNIHGDYMIKLICNDINVIELSE